LRLGLPVRVVVVVRVGVAPVLVMMEGGGRGGCAGEGHGEEKGERTCVVAFLSWFVTLVVVGGRRAVCFFLLVCGCERRVGEGGYVRRGRAMVDIELGIDIALWQ